MVDVISIDELTIETPDADIEIIVSEPTTESPTVTIEALPGPQGPPGSGGGGGVGGGGPEAPYNAGSIIGGTFQPQPENGAFQQITNNGAFKLLPPALVAPATAWRMVLRVINGPTAGAIDLSDFDLFGATVTAQVDNVYWFDIAVMPGTALIDVKLIHSGDSGGGGIELDFNNPETFAPYVVLFV